MRTHFHHTPEHRRKIAEANQGENHWLAKIDAEDARIIFGLRGIRSARQVCAIYEDIINPPAVYAIWGGLNWAHATGAKKAPRPPRKPK